MSVDDTPRVQPERLPRSTWIRYMVGMAVDSTGSGMYLPISLLFFHHVTGMPLLQVGAIMTAAALLAPVSSPFAGILVDRYGPRAVVVGGYLVRAVGFASYPFVDGPVGMFLAVALVALGDGSYPPSIQSLVAEIAQGSNRDNLLAAQRSLRNAGLGVGGLLAGAALALGTDAAFQGIVLVSGLGFLIAAIVMRTLPVPPPAVARRSAPGGPRYGYRLVAQNRVFLGLTLANIPTAFGYSVLAVGLPIYVTQHLGAPDSLVGVLYAVNTVGIALLQIPVTRYLARRAGRRTRVAALGGAVFALSFLAMAALGAVVSGLPLMIGVFVATGLFTIGELMHGATASALVAGAAPAETRGRHMAVYQLSWSLPTALAPVTLTALLAVSAQGMWLVLAVGVAVSALALLALEPKLPRDAVHPQPLLQTVRT